MAYKIFLPVELVLLVMVKVVSVLLLRRTSRMTRASGFSEVRMLKIK
jgi:hypothetical protein